MKNVTALIVSFLRPAYTVACIESLRRTYPEIQIIVGDNGGDDGSVKAACDTHGATLLPLPFDSGVCYARNRMVEAATTEYVLIGDDDFYYDPVAKVDEMKLFLDHNEDFDLIGGRILQEGTVRNYQGTIEKHTDHLQYTQLDVENAGYNLSHEIEGRPPFRYCQTDMVFNFFVARRERIADVPWDENIKVCYEHEDWFISMKEAGRKVAFTPDAIVIHKPEHVNAEVYGTPAHREYIKYRMRRDDREYFFNKHGVEYFSDMNNNRQYADGRHLRGNDRRSNDQIRHVDFCVTTILRPDCLERLLLSIARFYPTANIYVADQNKDFDVNFYRQLRQKLIAAGLQKRPIFESLPHDIGLSAARNHLVTTTPNKYKLILDDDMVFTYETKIEEFIRLLEAFPQVGVVGGLVRIGTQDLHYEFDLVKEGDTILQRPDGQATRTLAHHQGGTRYRKTGCVLNFALFRSDVFNRIRWDDELKITEHTDFYLRWPATGYGVLYAPDVSISHPPVERSRDYKEMRERDEFLIKMLRKHGARRVKYLNGQVMEIGPNDTITRYKERPE